MPKLEPIDLFNSLVRHPTMIRITAGEFKFEKHKLPNGTVSCIQLSSRAADELAMESNAYKEYFLASQALARLIDLRQSGQFVSENSMTYAKDMYTTARDLCRKLSVIIFKQDAIREYDK